jgi:hypothetical protein
MSYVSGNLLGRDEPQSGGADMAECRSGKTAHLSEGAARRSSVAVAKRRTHRKLRVYACPQCHCWHLTSALGHSRALARRPRKPLPEPHPVSREELDVWFDAHRRVGSRLLAGVA